MVRLLTRKRGFYILILNCLIDTYNKYLEPGYPGLIVEAWRDLEPEIFEWWVEVLKLTRPKVYLMRFICFCLGLHWFTIVYLDLACTFNVYSLSIQCLFNLHIFYILCIYCHGAVLRLTGFGKCPRWFFNGNSSHFNLVL